MEMALKHGNFGKFSKLVSIFSWFIEIAENVTMNVMSFLCFASHDISFFFEFITFTVTLVKTRVLSPIRECRDSPPKNLEFLSSECWNDTISSTKGLKPFPKLLVCILSPSIFGRYFHSVLSKKAPQHISL